jgi:superfamily II DNA/RNA helicase
MQQYLDKECEGLSRLVDKDAHLNLHNIRHEFLHCPDLDKHSTLLQALGQNQAKTIVFCNTISSLHELQYFLEGRGLTPLTLHSDLSKQARLQNFQLFRDSQNSLLLSTDLAARGLDIPDLQRVINYDFPLSTCDYLQRAGRTGRAVLFYQFRGKQVR